LRYVKPPLTLREQVTRLKQRGMIFSDERAAERVLARLNYYRLTAYWYPFYADANKHDFTPGTRFDTVIARYDFDRRLRLRVIDAIERFEIALRTQFAYQLAHKHGAWTYEEASLFADKTQHTSRLAALDRELNRSQETFVLHYREKYTPQRPPVWIACEVMSLGLLSGLFDGLKYRQDRRAISYEFGLDETVLRSFSHHVTFVRNICAHHARLWNRRFAITTKNSGCCRA
jgi:abortive infection bacteriophage resistance protein